MENPLVKQAGLLLKHAQEFKTLKSKHAETMETLKNHIKEGGVLKPLLTGLGIGGVGGVAVVDQAQKAKQKRQIIRTEMQQLPSAYTR
jgi:gas vesicle protein